MLELVQRQTWELSRPFCPRASNWSIAGKSSWRLSPRWKNSFRKVKYREKQTTHRSEFQRHVPNTRQIERVAECDGLDREQGDRPERPVYYGSGIA